MSAINETELEIVIPVIIPTLVIATLCYCPHSDYLGKDFRLNQSTVLLTSKFRCSAGSQ